MVHEIKATEIWINQCRQLLYRYRISQEHGAMEKTQIIEFFRPLGQCNWLSSKSITARKEKELQKLSIIETDKLSPSNVRLDGLQQVEIEHFLAREAQLDDEYWAAAWLRAEGHYENRENDRYAENYKRKFAEQEFNEMRKRYNAQLGEKCKCIVMVSKDINVERTIPKSVVGTLDLSVRYLLHGQTFPGDQLKPPRFWLGDGKSSSRYGYISNLCVAKSARRKGVASRMLHFAIMSSKAEGAEKVFVHVYKNNISAQCLYQKLGFQVIGPGLDLIETEKAVSNGEIYKQCSGAESKS
ncbi:hypothetical protein CASFOL_032413 [Castilleja foliolosa]|uniref:N-acetyltransferase domain-containing protein n=1 Tax=Castilleja foliolosa TaxID=1961234 RepID=A0ABD3C456_9LAMI